MKVQYCAYGSSQWGSEVVKRGRRGLVNLLMLFVIQCQLLKRVKCAQVISVKLVSSTGEDHFVNINEVNFV